MFDSNLCFAFLCIFQSARFPATPPRPPILWRFLIEFGTVVKAFVSIVQNLSKTCMFMGVFQFGININ